MRNEVRGDAGSGAAVRFLRLVWPGLAAWAAALVFLARPSPLGTAAFVLFEILLAGVHLLAVAALVYALLSLRARGGIATRLLSCAVNLSVVGLVAVDGLSYVDLHGSAMDRAPIAIEKCKQYRDAALMWSLVRGRTPDAIADLETPLRPGEEPFVVVEPDPWGGPYVLRRGEAGLEVRSWGPDGEEDTDDDVVYPPRR